MKEIIRLRNGVCRLPEQQLIEPASLTIYDEPTAIVGPNGSGKTKLVNLLTETYPIGKGELTFDFGPSCSSKTYDNIKYIAFSDVAGEGTQPTYYQQRWNRGDCDGALPTVADFLRYDAQNEKDSRLKALYEVMGIKPLLEKQLIMLSSGELRKVQLVKALHSFPRMLIIDNPYIGLDSDAREQVTALLEELVPKQAVIPILVLSRMEDVPDFITHIIQIEGEKVKSSEISRAAIMKESNHRSILTEEEKNSIRAIASQTPFTSDEIVRFNHISIRYGQHTIIENFSWRIANEDKWALRGKNGAGKSTLLSLICADNPQAYACDIALFGKKRGSGESIWDIKKKIGYVSPEMYRSYKKDLPTISIIASGLRDTIGLYHRPTEDEIKQCEFWSNLFGLKNRLNSSYLKLSSGEQRLALLARAFVKNPSLLILDEPFHGLDSYNCSRTKEIIETFCSARNKTLIMISHYDEDFPSCITDRLTLTKHQSL